ncbi:hypothetical protein [Sphingomonas sp. NFR04]|uniref:hypothetical protein n=1 Tax=Sphingomonas sp. NFR04 TaxID=1566283 RepID=UPI000B845F79|nr:hypothetical protein [Sphingomonas sp. NFR04]
MAIEEELDRFAAIGDDGSWLTVIAYRLVDTLDTPRGPRRLLGARAWRLSTSEPLLLVDSATYLVPATGELVRRLNPPAGGRGNFPGSARG